MAASDQYGTLKNVLPLLDLMHRFLLPKISRDMSTIMNQHGIRRVLDVACGTGYTVCQLHRRGIDIVGLDLSPAMLSVASQKAGSCGFVRGDGTTLPFREKSFDGAIISLALHEISPTLRQKVWSEMKRVVKSDGLLFILDFARLPAKRSQFSRIVSKAILTVEKSTLKFDPDHWHNSMEFQQRGGLTGWLQEVGSEVVEIRSYLGGNIILAVARNALNSLKFEV